MSEEHVVAIIVAGGSGVRAGGGAPKQYRKVGGRALVAHAHAAFAAHPAVHDVMVVVAPGTEQLARDAIGGKMKLVTGGSSRRESVAHGLAAAAATRATRVLIHDAARPFSPATVISAVVDALHTYEGALPALPVADTLAHGGAVLGEVVPRDGLVRVQTPQGFRLDAILRAHAEWPVGEEATDDAQMVRRLGVEVAVVQGDPMLEKVTQPSDFALAEARAGMQWQYRMATGFDVHRLEVGEELWLGGVLIPHDRGLSGHSDADVALHALTDALLGTIGAGDIGTHFPPSDPQWRGAESGQFLRHAVELIRARGGEVVFADLTIICEAPKVGPYRGAMTARIAQMLDVPADRVSVKATTTEKLGFTGRGEGIAAQAAATVRVPEL
ncbi:bifunctional 2-C-methyl-D-erythritol 4-phosphate cytidylyltransferase/2-C-methyl-D-erythritol 2,4-cyclodiphosphate synthase [Sphingomonas lenta]|uniref:Bifunctional enzyme IspD/IspF n=1 Tax=Sphingomonas lenta TaxID=1141887 RepID=A0A2A2SKR1_9SPHN|nr:bifunctional 2-C-methyl-D-erythritol 4-phosphate cytidylyltransferase/2-C-methyl-D-erythritol 2,4-cyclodiphosphate synthase [Sphingomonas lenta]PAX09601.1 bifunctional 2-C-methyl-D-erythritol 4-phosphate cytidylyltransferase/2-C-methyl-D-erythritol 2,4-cyclodiphosphate synthase [Sphingomonas lenta]